jgi:acyl-CoA thioester hydrolase
VANDEQAELPFCYRLRVRYDECDAQKVVFNARYGSYIDLAVLEFFRAMGLADLLVKGPIDYQLVKQTLEWKAPAHFDEVLEISISTRQLGNTSLTLAAEFRLAGREEPIATAETVYVLVDAATLTKTPIPAEIRPTLRRGGAGLVIDHADSSAMPAASRAVAQT